VAAMHLLTVQALFVLQVDTFHGSATATATLKAMALDTALTFYAMNLITMVATATRTMTARELLSETL